MTVLARQDPDDPTSPWLCSTDGCGQVATSQWPSSCDGSACPTVGSPDLHAHPVFGCDAHPRPAV